MHDYMYSEDEVVGLVRLLILSLRDRDTEIEQLRKENLRLLEALYGEALTGANNLLGVV